MSHVVSEQQYELPEPGLHNAIFRDVNSLGLVASMWEGEQKLNDKIRVWFELQDRDSRDHYVVLRRDYNIAMGKKAKLPELIEAVLGERKSNVDLDHLIGRPVQLIVVHAPSKDGRIWANIKEVLPWPAKLKMSQVLDPDYIRVEHRVGYVPPPSVQPKVAQQPAKPAADGITDADMPGADGEEEPPF